MATKKAVNNKCNKQQRVFAKEYIVDLNGKQAAIRAGYSPKTADVQAARLLADAKVQALVQTELAKREERTEIKADEILVELTEIVRADANELCELQRTCCRYCYGEGHRYQFTQNEMAEAKKRHETDCILKGIDIPFDEKGGDGFDLTLPPNVECPECRGTGIMTPFFKDTRNLSRGAKALYAGVKLTKGGGVEIVMQRKDRAIELLGKHLGLFADKLDINVTGNIAVQLRERRQRMLKNITVTDINADEKCKPSEE